MKSLSVDEYGPIERLDEITREAGELFDAPIAMINLVTSDSIIFKSCTGLTRGGRLDRSGSFCSLASSQEKPLVIADATLDTRFKNNSLVLGQLKIRSYVGKSLYTPDGAPFGTLCLLDTKPRKYSSKQLRALRDLAKRAEHEFSKVSMPKQNRTNPKLQAANC